MTATLDRAMTDPPPTQALRAVYCRRCGRGARPLCAVGPGVVVIKCGRREFTIAGQRAWAKCEQCGLQQEIVIPTRQEDQR